jgi:hypothetical protein
MIGILTDSDEHLLLYVHMYTRDDTLFDIPV